VLGVPEGEGDWDGVFVFVEEGGGLPPIIPAAYRDPIMIEAHAQRTRISIPTVFVFILLLVYILVARAVETLTPGE